MNIKYDFSPELCEPAQEASKAAILDLLFHKLRTLTYFRDAN